VAVKIKLKRIGKVREPHYRIVIADARTARGGRAIEEIGQYHPLHDPSLIQVDSERVQYWLGVGAQPTEAVAAILRVTGDWQSFKGEPAPPAMLVAEPKADKKSVFEAAAKEAAGLNEKAATTPKAKKKAAPKADESAESAAAEPKAKDAAAPEAPEAPEAEAKDAAEAPAEASAGTTADAAAETPAETPAGDAGDAPASA
jgi:small subunit ribosomal protein S16